MACGPFGKAAGSSHRKSLNPKRAMGKTAQAEIQIAGKTYRLSPLTAGEFCDLGELLAEINETASKNLDRVTICSQTEKLLAFLHSSIQRVQPEVTFEEIRNIAMPDLTAAMLALTRISTPKPLTWVH